MLRHCANHCLVILKAVLKDRLPIVSRRVSLVLLALELHKGNGKLTGPKHLPDAADSSAQVLQTLGLHYRQNYPVLHS